MLPGKKYKPEDFLAIAWRYKWFLVIPFLVIAAGTFVVSQVLPNRYYSETLIQVVPQRVPESYVRPTVTMRVEDRLQGLAQQIMSRTRLETIIREFNLYPKERERGIMEDVVQKMRNDIKVDIPRSTGERQQTDAFKLGYTAPDARTAQKVTERLATLFIDQSLQDRGVLAETTSQFLETQLADARNRLEQQEKKLEEFRRRNSGELPTQTQTNMQAVQNLQMQLQALSESINRDRDRRLMLQRLYTDLSEEVQAAAAATPMVLPGAPGGDAQNQQPRTAAEQLDLARAALQQMELRLKPEHPDIVRMKRTIRDLEKKAQDEEAQKPLSPSPTQLARSTNPQDAMRQERLKQMQAEMESLDRQIAFKEKEEARVRGLMGSYQARLEAVPGVESEWVALTRDYDTTQKSYQELLAKYEDSKVAANLERRQIGEQFRILDPANYPERPVSPDRMRINLLGAAAGLGLGVLLVGLLEYKDRSFRSELDVLSVLALPVLAVVPRIITAAERHRARRRRLLTSVAVSAVVAIAVAGAVWKLQLWRVVLGG